MAKRIKTGGRKKGTTNKLTGTTRELISQIVTQELRKLPDLLNQMEPKEKADCIIKLLPYVSTKMISVEVAILVRFVPPISEWFVPVISVQIVPVISVQIVPLGS